MVCLRSDRGCHKGESVDPLAREGCFDLVRPEWHKRDVGRGQVVVGEDGCENGNVGLMMRHDTKPLSLQIGHLFDLARLWGGDQKCLLAEDGQGQAVIGQEHVRAYNREINLVLSQRVSALTHVIEGDDLEPDVSAGVVERLSKGVDQTRLRAVLWADSDGEAGGCGEVPVSGPGENGGENQKSRAKAEVPMSLPKEAEEGSHAPVP